MAIGYEIPEEVKNYLRQKQAEPRAERYDSEPSPDTRAPAGDILKAMQTLARSIDQLEKSVIELRDRCRPAMVPAVAVGPGASDSSPIPARSELAGVIATQAERVEDLDGTVRAMLAGLQL